MSLPLQTVAKPVHQPVGHQQGGFRTSISEAKRSASRVGAIFCSGTARPMEQTYEAISYCWGNCLSKTNIILNGLKFMAPSSAVTPLVYFRQSAKPRFVWIDALCIDQTNDREKEHQVAMMGAIYVSAASTLVWLGVSQDDEKTKHAVRFCSNPAQRIVSEPQQSGIRIEELDQICEEISLPDDYDYSVLEIIFDSPWYSRTWVVQEVALAKRATCYIGQFSIPSPIVMMASFWANECTRQIGRVESQSLIRAQSNISMACGILSLEMHSTFQSGLLDLLTLTRRAEATDPRDKIYGVLGLTRRARTGRELPDGVVPNYKKSVRSCMRDATRVMIQETVTLRAIASPLRYVSLDHRFRDEAWPSWVPRWYASDRHNIDRLCVEMFSADDGVPLSTQLLNVADDHDLPIVEGFILDRVKNTFPMLIQYFEGVPHFTMSLQIMCILLGFATMQSFIWFLIAEQIDRERIKEGDLRIERFANWVQESQDPGTVAGRNTEISGQELYRRASQIMDACSGQAMFLTSSGLKGPAHASVQEDDIVVILYGSNSPFVLRQESEHYQLVGPCYVQGVMDGEVVRERKSQGIGSQIFEIR